MAEEEVLELEVRVREGEKRSAWHLTCVLVLVLSSYIIYIYIATTYYYTHFDPTTKYVIRVTDIDIIMTII